MWGRYPHVRKKWVHTWRNFERFWLVCLLEQFAKQEWSNCFKKCKWRFVKTFEIPLSLHVSPSAPFSCGLWFLSTPGVHMKYWNHIPYLLYRNVFLAALALPTLNWMVELCCLFLEACRIPSLPQSSLIPERHSLNPHTFYSLSFSKQLRSVYVFFLPILPSQLLRLKGCDVLQANEEGSC